jgi:hypothetical protein
LAASRGVIVFGKLERLVRMPSKKAKTAVGDGKPSHKKSEEALWKERERRLQELLEKDGGPNPKVKEDFNRLLEETVRRNSR